MAASAPAADGSYVPQLTGVDQAGSPIFCAVCGVEIHDGEHIDLYGDGFAHAGCADR
jgi:hypothetical protein